MRTKMLTMLTIPSESIFGQGVTGVIRGCLDDRGELTVKTPFEMDTIKAFRIMLAFDRLVQTDGRSVMGCAFISAKQ